MEIHKKILPEYFDAVMSGEKKFELRLADEDLISAKPGDVLVLEEYTSLDKATRKPTGRVIKKVISDVQHLTLNELSQWWPREEIEKKGFLIFSLKD